MNYTVCKGESPSQQVRCYRPKPKRLYRYGLYIGSQGHGRTPRNTMSKDLRSTMDESQFRRFKSLKARLGAGTNDEAIVMLMDFYEDNNGVVGNE